MTCGTWLDAASGVAPELPPRYLMSADSAVALGRRIDALMDTGTVYVAEPSMNAASLSSDRRQAVRLDTSSGCDSTRWCRYRHVFDRMQHRRSPGRCCENGCASSRCLRRVTWKRFRNCRGRRAMCWRTLRFCSRRCEPGRSNACAAKPSSWLVIRRQRVVARGAGGQKSIDRDQALERLAVAVGDEADQRWLLLLLVQVHAQDSSTPSPIRSMADAIGKAFQATTNADLLEAFGQTRPPTLSEEALDRFSAPPKSRSRPDAQGSHLDRAGHATVRLRVAERSAVREARATLKLAFVPTGRLAAAPRCGG